MNIFISYRRSDSKVFTGRILDRLTRSFGNKSVFRDIEDIPIGKDFRDVLRDAVSQCDVMLVIIGPQWASVTNSDGTKRLFDTNDFVRFEVETGLKRKNLIVIPVLVLNASMPSPEDLPQELKDLVYRNAIIVRDDPDFSTDIQRLIQQIRRVKPVEQALKWVGIVIPGILLLTVATYLFSSWNSGVKPTNDGNSSITNAPIVLADSTQTATSIEVGKHDLALKSFTLYQDADENSLIVMLVSEGTTVEVIAKNETGDWLQVKLDNGKTGWVAASDLHFPAPISVTPISVGKGYGARSNAWQVYFTSPSDNPNPETDLGIEVRLATSINKLEKSLDIAAYEFDNKILTQAVLDAHQRGVKVRIVTDDEFGLSEPENTFSQLQDAGIPIITDERSALMHDNFMILDGKTVWTGSWSYTEKGTYSSNDNALAFDSADLVALYQHEFDQLFVSKEFSPTAPVSPVNATVTAGIPIEVYFSPHDQVNIGVLDVIRKAHTSIRFMVFSFTNDEMGQLLQEQVQKGVNVQGIFERVGSGTTFSELTPLFCAHADVRTDGSKYILHHKVVIIDDSIIITGSANYSTTTFESNNENTIVIYDPSLASVYIEEFNRQWAIASAPTDITCP